jgi:enoyl-CoA hydratase/carnithine racemase
MSETSILLTIDGPVATITLNRPDKLNAIDPELLAELEAAVGELDRRDDVHVVLLTGAGDRAFCAGADIHAWSAVTPIEMWRTWLRDGHRVFDRVASLRPPVIAALNGYTFGGGLELALAADLRLAAEGIELALPEVKLGIIPGWGGTQRLPALIGKARAKQMIFTGMRVDAATAERWGLVNEVAAPDALMARAQEFAAAIAANAPLAVQFAKQSIDGSLGHSPALESLAGALAATTEDNREGVAAFRERRPARFRGA